MSQKRITILLKRAQEGDSAAQAELMELVYPELRRLARNRLRREPRNPTLRATELVHEAYLRIVGQTRVQWRSRAHFYAVAAKMMRRVLVDYARKRTAEKRGGGGDIVELNENVPEKRRLSPEEMLALDQALSRLETMAPRQARIVELRYFGELTREEVADVLAISQSTVKRDMRAARAWLRREMSWASS